MKVVPTASQLQLTNKNNEVFYRMLEIRRTVTNGVSGKHATADKHVDLTIESDWKPDESRNRKEDEEEGEVNVSIF